MSLFLQKSLLYELVLKHYFYTLCYYLQLLSHVVLSLVSTIRGVYGIL
jgi:hypothetical protein